VVTGTKQARVNRGDHAGPEFDARLAVCTQAVNLGAVHHLAQYNYGTLDFSIDVLDQVDPASASKNTDTSRRKEDVGHLGRQLHFMMRDIGAALEECDSGRLIRAKFDVGAGALLFYEVLPGEYLVGLALGAGSVPAADRAMAGAVGKIRGLLSLSDQNPGGFTPRNGEPVGLAPADPASFTASRAGGAGEADDVFLGLAFTELERGSLHYAARFEKSACTSSADILDDQRLRDFFTKITRERRRAVYQELGGHFHALSGSVDRALYGIVGQRTLRTVLDVEEGALYVRHRNRDEHLLGVTLVQKWVRTANDHFDDLVQRYERAGGRAGPASPSSVPGSSRLGPQAGRER
jgi:hypothetical protein